MEDEKEKEEVNENENEAEDVINFLKRREKM
jgi:hypothetical protein